MGRLGFVCEAGHKGHFGMWRVHPLLAAAFLFVSGSRDAALADPVTAPTLSAQPIVVPNCRVQASVDIKVPARVPGVLIETNVREGDWVEANQTLAVVDNKVAEIRVRHSKASLENTSSIEVAQASLEHSKVKHRIEVDLLRKGAGKDLAVEEARLQVVVDEKRVKNAQIELELSRFEYDAAEAELEQHIVKSERGGRITEEFHKEGESVEKGEPIFRVVDDTRIKVEGEVDLSYAGLLRPGMEADIVPNMASPSIGLPHTQAVHAVHIMPDRNRIVTGDALGHLHVWDRTLGREVDLLRQHRGAVFALAGHPKQPELLLSGGEDAMLSIWDLAARKVRSLAIPEGRAIHSIAVSPSDPNECVTGHDDGSIRIWNLQTGEVRATLDGHTNIVTSLAYSPTRPKTMLLSAAEDGTVRLWNPQSGEPLLEQPFEGRTSEVEELGFSPDGKYFTFNSGHLLQVRQLSNSSAVANLESQGQVFSGVALFVPRPESDGLLLLTATEDLPLQLWKIGLGERDASCVVRTYPGHAGAIRSVAIDPEGQFFASASDDRFVRLWEIPSADRLARERHRSTLRFVAPQAQGGAQELRFTVEVDNSELYQGERSLKNQTLATVVIYPLEVEALAAGSRSSKP